MADPAILPPWLPLRALSRWGGFIILAGSLAFIGERLWRLDWSTLQPFASWPLAAALMVALLLFAAADHALARAWAAMADPERGLSNGEIMRIYGHGVLMKYLPGSIFQYVSRHMGGAKAGLAHMRLARSNIVEVGLHLVSSLVVATPCLLFDRAPLAAAAFAAAVPICACLSARRPLLIPFALQIAAFAAFALAAALIGAVILPPDTSLAHFSGLFLLAWLVGFVVPVAPGGLGVREAALLALAGASLPAESVLAATLALRVASIAGDVVYGFVALAQNRPA
jgi:uncharacterized membrane protein YbhN (UPF0104 family)